MTKFKNRQIYIWLICALVAIAAVFSVVVWKSSRTVSAGFMTVPQNISGKGYSVSTPKPAADTPSVCKKTTSLPAEKD